MKTTFQYPNAAANFQLGFMTSFGQGNYELVNDRNHFPGLYAQDSWKANRRFTINYGVRWEPFVPWANNVSKQSGAGTGFGNVVKDSLRGPGLTNWDVAMIRYFPIWRETNLQFRAEYFDVLNHTELSNPSVSNPISSSTSFGTITGTQGGPRIAQFALKFVF